MKSDTCTWGAYPRLNGCNHLSFRSQGALMSLRIVASGKMRLAAMRCRLGGVMITNERPQVPTVALLALIVFTGCTLLAPEPRRVELRQWAPGIYSCSLDTTTTQRTSVNGMPDASRSVKSTQRMEARWVIQGPDSAGALHATLRITRMVRDVDGEVLDTDRLGSSVKGWEFPPILVRTTFAARLDPQGDWVETGSDLASVVSEALPGDGYRDLRASFTQSDALKNMVSRSLSTPSCFRGVVAVGDVCETKTPTDLPLLGSDGAVTRMRLDRITTSPTGDVAEISSEMTIKSPTGGTLPIPGFVARTRNVRVMGKVSIVSKVANGFLSKITTEMTTEADLEMKMPGMDLAHGKLWARMTSSGSCEPRTE